MVVVVQVSMTVFLLLSFIIVMTVFLFIIFYYSVLA
jgi:hypothetical protein